MRVNHGFARTSRYWVARGAAAGLALCGAIPDALAGDLMQRGPSLWVPATALSLTLVTAVIRSQK